MIRLTVGNPGRVLVGLAAASFRYHRAPRLCVFDYNCMVTLFVTLMD